MALTECANGHLYDSAQYPTCPYCGGNMNRMEFSAAPDPGVGKTVGVAPSAPAPQPDTGKTVAGEGEGLPHRRQEQLHRPGR